MKIDVTIATKDNEHTIEKVIQAVQENIPYNEIILVDDSSDNTPRLAEALGAKVYRVEGRLGVKRIMQAKLSRTQWIASIDSDVIVYPNWWEKMTRPLADNRLASVGGYLESDFKIIFPDYEKYTKFCAGFRRKFVKRSGTIGCTLIKREVLLLCEEALRHVHAGEDTVIGKVLQKRGFKHVTVRDVVGYHFHRNPVDHHIMAYFRAGKSSRSGLGTWKALFACVRFLSLQFLQMALFASAEKRPTVRLWSFVSLLSVLYVAGFLNSQKLRDRAEAKIGLFMKNCGLKNACTTE
ncbi:MAG: glycosyltransferase family 2 protein [Deltaproteobacteria bacterium]|nr:glycosyltransferase family 2 protein [Deltaproteobacteria bacterium]MBW2017586.1 glycosyltransferase family 2 protein [Deltaproteobacteria bacterium]MBW2130377.1 glycosyltransferase family 2 protein [Deltaproteobacteria bacterium]MBW2304264.1 glycosyltransferase family 2 protein [Deltaproteobacteria bacterium]